MTATNASTRLQFSSATAGTYGVVIDNVTLEPVPPPATDYSVIISNVYGSVTSSVAQVQFDVDGNGLPDSWERMYFGSIGQDPNADSDGDGISNGQEFQDGTDPTNAASFRPRLYLSATPGGVVTAAPAQPNYVLNDPVQIAAIPDPGNLFCFWSGSITDSNAVVNLVMDATKTITAIFGQEMTNGGNYDGAIAVGETNYYAFTANIGDNVVLRLGSSFYSRLVLYGPDGSPLHDNFGNNTDKLIGYTATNSGTFTVQVQSYASGGAGTYTLHYFKVPGSFIVPSGDEGGPMVNGSNYDGTIDLGDADLWTFDATNGDNVVLRLGSSFYSRLVLYGPDGTDLQDLAGNSLDKLIGYTVTNSGTFTVRVDSYSTGGNGTYTLHYFKVPGSFIVPPGDEGGEMANGSNYDGTITLADVDLWTFDATNGDSVTLQLGSSFYSRLVLYGPDGADLQDVAGNSFDKLIGYTVTNSGTFTVRVDSFTGGGTGTYTLHYFKVPGSFIVPPGDEGGPMVNGSNYDGTIDVGDADLWTFDATNGDNIVLRLGSSFYSRMNLYGPDGKLLENAAGNNLDKLIGYTATNSGTFTVLVDSYANGGSGTYTLHYFKVPGSFIVPPGDEGGPMTNGSNYDGMITLGDVDLWTFDATNGESVTLQLGSSFYSRLVLYGPDGTDLQDVAGNSFDKLIGYTVTNSGTFTVRVDSYATGGTGSYTLHYFKVPGGFIVPPGDESGPMINGSNYDGTIDVGDADLWTFDATNGDNVVLRLGSSFYSRLVLYGPDGSTLQNLVGNSTDKLLNYTVTNSGTFAVLVDSYANGGSGTYTLHYFKVPESFVVPVGDDGGSMVNGGNYDGTIDLADVDPWTFTASTGDNIVLRLGSSGFNGQLLLYGPDGALLRTAATGNGTDWLVSYTATNSGTFTVLVTAYNGGGTGTYQLHYFNASGDFIVPDFDDGGPMTNGGNCDGIIYLGDLDPWTFTANAGDNILLRLGSAGFNGQFLLYGPDGALLQTAANANKTDWAVAYTATNSGTFTVLVHGYNLGGTGSYRLHYFKVPGNFIVPMFDDGGVMINGANYTGTIDLGDMDPWAFTACTGDTISLHLNTTNFNGRLQLYGANGALLQTAQNSKALSLTYTATNCGTFVALVSSYNAVGTGTYQLNASGITDGLDGLKLLTPIISGTNLYLFGTGGASNVQFVLYSTTNLAQPAVLWTPILTNNCDTSGTFNVTNLYNPGENQQYFRISVP